MVRVRTNRQVSEVHKSEKQTVVISFFGHKWQVNVFLFVCLRHLCKEVFFNLDGVKTVKQVSGAQKKTNVGNVN